MANRFLFSPLLGFFLFTVKAYAYPEYAVRYNVMRCTACHISPVGGGPKTVYGKLFGAHGYKLNPVLAQDYVSADFRVLAYYPQRASGSKGGMGVMSASVAGHAALDEDKRIHLVIDHNIGGFQAGAAGFRDTYALFRLSPEDGKPHWFESLMVGRFRAPFGIITDEHRTYTRVQTATEWYTFETGLLLSGTPSDKTHFDLAVVNGEKSPGTSLNQAQAERWGALFNLRYMPGPVLLGTSGSYHQHSPERESRQAASVYTIISLGRWTADRVPLSIRLEHVRAKNWGNHLGQGFISDPAYVSTLNSSVSYGWLAWFDWALSNRLTLTYKYDWLTPDRDYPSDIYDRHGFGVRWAVGPGTLLQLRTEFARATHPGEAHGTANGPQNATFALLQMYL